ncbi:MAG: helix-turn-helix domain-containing protein [Bacteroidota bacterium]
MSTKNKIHIPTHELPEEKEIDVPFDFQELEEKGAHGGVSHHRHDYYELFLFLKGGGTHEIDFETFAIEDNSIHFISPGQIHLLNRDKKSKGYVVLFSREFYHLGNRNIDALYDLLFLNKNNLNPTIRIPKSLLPLFINQIQNIETEFSSSNADKPELLYTYLQVLLIQSKRLFLLQSEVLPGNPSTEMLQRFRVAVEKNFRTIHKVSAYADLLCVTPSHLNDVIQESAGISASQLIHDRLILEAKRMLFHSDESISQIANALSFEDSSYFTRFFKKQSGMPPGDFRINIRKKYQ